MRWRDLQPGDQLVPLPNVGADPHVVLEVRASGSASVKLTFLNARTGQTHSETRYGHGSAALGFEVVRDGAKVV